MPKRLVPKRLVSRRLVPKRSCDAAGTFSARPARVTRLAKDVRGDAQVTLRHHPAVTPHDRSGDTNAASPTNSTRVPARNTSSAPWLGDVRPSAGLRRLGLRIIRAAARELAPRRDLRRLLLAPSVC